MMQVNPKGAPYAYSDGEGQRSPVGDFFIPAATSLQEKRPHSLKHDDLFGVFDHNGDIYSATGSPEGLYYRDTRHLSYLYLTVDDARPMLLSSTVRDDNLTLTCDLANPDLVDKSGRVVLEHDLIHLGRSCFLWQGTCFERLAIRNFDGEARHLKISIAFAADFADLFEVRGTAREKRGSYHPVQVLRDRVTLSYTGLDGIRRETCLCFDPKPTVLTGDRAIFEMSVAPHQTRTVFFDVRCNSDRHDPATGRDFFLAAHQARRALRASKVRAASIETSNDIFNEAITRSVTDIYTLVTDTPEGPYPYAGIPWFSTPFGRDALITALEVLWLDPAIAKGVLQYLAVQQATEIDPVADAEPGKILHEMRLGEMARLGEVPFRRYYGSVDSTPLFIMLAGAYLDRTGDAGTIGKLWPNLEAALRWIDEYGDRDSDGFVEYGRRTSEGLVNQGWKDSQDSISHDDGTLAHGPIALVEVQAYVYGAWRAAAGMARRIGRANRAAELDQKADDLRERFDKAFFDAALGTYALALDGDKRPCRVRSSNAGHALFTGIAYPERAPAVVATLMNGSSFSGWGIRTLASTEARYNPMSYHNGSVWPHDNAIIAAGFSRYGFRQETAKILEGLFAAAARIELRRLPELFCGFPRQRNRGPTSYPVACSPQAWASATLPSLLQSSLGLGFDPTSCQITLDRPMLPKFLDKVELRGLSASGGAVDVALRCAGSGVAVHVLRRDSDLRVLAVN